MKTDKALKNELFNLQSSVAFVTGGGGQLGRHITEALCEFGASVIIADSDEAKAKEAGERIGLGPERILSIKCDVTKRDDVARALAEGINRFSNIDILINNAGVSVFEPFLERTEESIDHVTDVNLKGTILCIQEFVKKWKAEEGGKGKIINIASHYGLISPDPRIYGEGDRRNSEIYGATKAGVIQMTRYFATHLAPQNIRVNSISPGGIFNPDSPQSEQFIKNYTERCPMSRMGDAGEIEGAVIYLASEAARYVNGHNLVIDGGMSAW